MQSKRKQKVLRFTLIGLIVLVLVWLVAERANRQNNALPDGFVMANGRIEADQIDIASKYPGRVKTVFVEEGDLVSADQLVAKLDVTELNATLARAEAEVARAAEAELEAQAQLEQSRNRLKLAERELERVRPLVKSGAISRSNYDQRKNNADNAAAAEQAAVAHLHTLEKTTLAAQAQVQLVQSQIDDCSLTSPVRGRVLYRLTENSEVVGAGAPMLTIVDLSDIYMEVYLPASGAALVAIGAEARLKLDILPDYAIPAEVVFVSPQAQFTPKQVETRSDRENLMFRVKLRIPQSLVEQHIERVKTGVRGDAYVQLDDAAQWPDWLAVKLPAEPGSDVSAGESGEY